MYEVPKDKTKAIRGYLDYEFDHCLKCKEYNIDIDKKSVGQAMDRCLGVLTFCEMNNIITYEEGIYLWETLGYRQKFWDFRSGLKK